MESFIAKAIKLCLTELKNDVIRLRDLILILINMNQTHKLLLWPEEKYVPKKKT